MRSSGKQKNKTPSLNKRDSFAVKWETKPFEGKGYVKEKKIPWSTEASSLWRKKISNQPDKAIMDGMWTTLINTAPKQCIKEYISKSKTCIDQNPWVRDQFTK